MRLLERTLTDIKSFMILFFIALAMFGSVMFMLQLNVKYASDDELFQIVNSKVLESENDALVESITGVFFFDIMIN